MLDAFLTEARSWGMRQARRAYRHLPEELHEQGFDQASVALKTGAPPQLDRRTLYAELARHLDDELRRIHVGWCLNQTRVADLTSPVEKVPSTQQAVTAFIEDGLGGLERAVLQLELAAGRDTSTVRAALRLPARQYARHRELGLAKLRGAISGGLSGRVCDQHLEAVTLAATGDRDAADRLASGPERCRACAREASGLRRVLQQRLALAPWPLVIKPAGVIAAKIGAIGAIVGGKGTASVVGSSVVSTASGAKVVASLMATAALASAGIAGVEREREREHTKKEAEAAAASSGPAAPATPVVAAAPAREAAHAKRGRAAAKRKKAAKLKAKKPSTATPAAAATAQPQAVQPESGRPTASTPQAKPTDTVRETVDGVRKTVDKVTGKLPAPVADPVDQAVDGVDRTVDGVTGTVDDLLAP